MASVIDEHKQWVGTDGKPIVNGFIYIGVKNQDPVLNSTPIYSDRVLVTQLSNPQSTDEFGRAVNKIWIPGEYSIQVNDVNNIQKYLELDNGEGVGASAGITTLMNVQGSNDLTAEAQNTIVAYSDNETYIFKAANANTGAVTLDIDTLGAKSVVHSSDVDLKLGDIKQNQTIVALYNSTTDSFHVQNHGDAKCNNTASAAPTVDNDVTEGYTVGSEWIDINNKVSYICLDNVDGAALWRITARTLDNFVATAPPGVGDDIDSGYKPGSSWIDTTNKNAYINIVKQCGCCRVENYNYSIKSR